MRSGKALATGPEGCGIGIRVYRRGRWATIATWAQLACVTTANWRMRTPSRPAISRRGSTAMRAALRGERDSDVPCGGCTRLLHGIAVHPHRPRRDRDARPHPRRRCSSPRRSCPRATSLLGHDERGHCPMLRDGPLLDLRRSAADVPHLRLPRVRGGGRGLDAGGRPDRRASAALAVRLPHRRPTAAGTRRCATAAVFIRDHPARAAGRARAGERDPARRARGRDARAASCADPDDDGHGAAVDAPRGAGDVGGPRRAQERDHDRDLLARSPSARAGGRGRRR